MFFNGRRREGSDHATLEWMSGKFNDEYPTKGMLFCVGILGRPVVEALDMPNIASGATPIIFGDFKAGYRIYDRVALDILPDLLTQRTVGMARFHARRRVGAGVVRTDVFRKLKMAA